VHYTTATEIRAQRALALDAAYDANPDRFRGRPPYITQTAHSRLDQRPLTRSQHPKQINPLVSQPR